MADGTHASERAFPNNVVSRVHLRLLGTTDLHAHVFPYNYYADERNEGVGLARTASLISAAKAEAPNCLVLDNGDFLQGTPLGDYAATHGPRNALHPVIAAMNAAGIEAATLGNHEFNYGIEFLENAVAGAAFPIVSANVLRKIGCCPAEDTTLLPPFVVLERDCTDAQGHLRKLKIGVIGFAPPQIMDWDRGHLSGKITVRGILDAARGQLPLLRAAGADIIVALCHSGFGSSDAGPDAENAALALAELGGIDAVMAGHTHLVFPSEDFADHPGLDISKGTAAGIPAVMAGANGSQLGVIDLLLEEDATGWTVVESASDVRDIATRQAGAPPRGHMPCDRAVKRDVLDLHHDTLAYVRRPIGHLEAPLSSHFAMVAPCPCAMLVARAQSWYLQRHLADTPYGNLPLLSAAASFKTGGRGGPEHFTDIPAGQIALRHAADLYAFPNRLCALRVTGAELRDWLERAAGIFRQIVPGGADQMLLDPRFPPYNFDLIAGVRYEIDLSQPARFAPCGLKRAADHSRIRDLNYKGTPVRDEQLFIVATNDYRAGGGGQFPGATEANMVFEGADLSRDVLIDFIKQMGASPAPDAGPWRFHALPDTSVLFDTSPRAAPGDAPTLRDALESLDQTDTGFQRYRLRL